MSNNLNTIYNILFYVQSLLLYYNKSRIHVSNCMGYESPQEVKEYTLLIAV